VAGDGKPNHAFNQWATELGKPVLSFDQAALIEAMAGGITTRDGLAEPSQITVRNTAGEEFDRIVGYELSALPAMREPGADENEPVPVLAWDDFDDEPPF